MRESTTNNEMSIKLRLMRDTQTRKGLETIEIQMINK